MSPSSLSNRGENFEQRFAHDKEMQFKVYVRRNYLFGLWAASRLKKEAGEAESYAQALVDLDLGTRDAKPVIAKVSADFKQYGIEDLREEDLQYFLDRQFEEAQRHILSGTK